MASLRATRRGAERGPEEGQEDQEPAGQKDVRGHHEVLRQPQEQQRGERGELAGGL